MDTVDELPVFPTQRRASPVVLLLQLVVLLSLALLLSGFVSFSLLVFSPGWGEAFGVPGPFLIATSLLVLGSVAIERAVAWVRVEKQVPFRRWLVLSVVAWAVFVGLQTFALSTLIADRQDGGLDVGDLANAGSLPFAIAVVTMHLLHAVAAMSVLSWLTVQAVNDRFDHEYYRPVRYCGYFWHFLGFAWMSVLLVLVVAL